MGTDMTTTDFADFADFTDYRLRMRAGPLRAAEPSYYLAGLTHGIRHGVRATDLEVRARLTGVIRATHPNAVLHDPLRTWRFWRDGRPDCPDGLAEFHRLAGLAAASDVCVAVVPDRDTVIDSVAEMQLARRAGRTVVAITEQPDELLVRAHATVVLSGMEEFAGWLAA